MTSRINRFEQAVQKHQEVVDQDSIDPEELVDSLRILEDDTCRIYANAERGIRKPFATVIELSQQALQLTNVEPPLSDEEKGLVETRIKMMEKYIAGPDTNGPTNTRAIKTGGVKA